ncbi:MAG: ATP synthase F1 subunit delta [Bacteroides sp.]|nr:ATP synthase F1 subunit delta [Bacteroides sp.]
MNDGLIPARYAKALYLVGHEKKVDDKLYELAKRVVAAFVAEPGLQPVLSNPYVSDSDKQQLLLTAAAADKSDAVYEDFLKLLARNRRLDFARSICDAYISLYRKINKIYDVKIVSASPLDKENLDRIKQMITDHLHGGTMEYSVSVDPDLIGGFTVSVGNERIDASISNELKQLRLNLIRK